MKASIAPALGEAFVVGDVSVASPLGREVLIEVRASGLCHTDLTISRTGLSGLYDLPAVLGHEVAGVVTDIGPGVSTIRAGDHVVGCLIHFCGACRNCMSGRTYQCLNTAAILRKGDDPPRLSRRGAGILHQGFGLGGFAEQALIHENQLAVVPDSLPFPQAALLGCGVVTGAGAVLNTANVQAGDAVVVIGTGGVGLNAISGALIAGASTIIAVDVQDEKLERATAFGATHVINSSATDPVVAVMDITTTGADHVFDVVGFEEVSRQGHEMLAQGGGLYLIGVGHGDTVVPIDTEAARSKQSKIQAVRMGSTNLKRDIPLYASLYLQGRMNLDDLVSQEIALDQVNEGYAALEKNPNLARLVITSF